MTLLLSTDTENEKFRNGRKPVTELGKRFKCYKCNCKFYDMNKPSPICPRCGEDQTNEENKKILKRKRKRSIGKGRTDVRPDVEGVDIFRDNDHEPEEYTLDVEDMILEETAELIEEEKEPAEDE